MEMLEFEHGVVGLAFNLEEDDVGAALFGEWEQVKRGRAGAAHRQGRERPGRRGAARPRRRPARQPARRARPDRRSEHGARSSSRRRASIARQPVKEPLQTGIKAIDSMTNVGRGQRELIIGDRSTGKTAILIDTILNQRDTDVHCVYVAIGQKASTVAGIYERLREAGAMEYTTIVTAGRAARPRRSSGWRRSPAPRWASTSSSRASTRSSCTTTSRSTRTRTASSRCCCAARRAARRSRATSSTSTRGCSSARASSTTSRAAARSRRCR